MGSTNMSLGLKLFGIRSSRVVRHSWCVVVLDTEWKTQYAHHISSKNSRLLKAKQQASEQHSGVGITGIAGVAVGRGRVGYAWVNAKV